MMKTLLKLEEAGMAAFGICMLGIYKLMLPIWVWVLFFFAHDISMQVKHQ